MRVRPYFGWSSSRAASRWPSSVGAWAHPASYVACALFGLSVGNVITLPALVVQREFPAASFGTVIGLSTAIGQVTYAFGPALVGLAHDATGGYGASLALCIALELLGAVAILVRPSGTPRDELAAARPAPR